MNKHFKRFMDNIQVVKETTLVLVLNLPPLGSISLQTRTNLKKSLKSILNCCKFQIVFKSGRHLYARVDEHIGISQLTKKQV